MIEITSTPIARLFWEYGPETATVPDGVVFARVIERETLDDTRWLLQSIPSRRLSEWFDVHAARHLTARSLSLWACVLDRPLPISTALAWHDSR